MCYRKPADGDVQRRHSRQPSGRQRPVSTGALAATTATSTPQNSAPAVSSRNGVSTSTPSVPHQLHHGPSPPPPPPPQGKATSCGSAQEICHVITQELCCFSAS